MVKLRFLLAWGAYAKGDVITPPAMLRQQLLSTVFYGRRIVEEVKDNGTEPTLKLRFLMAWGDYPKGAIIETPIAQGKQLLARIFYGRRVVEEVNEETNDETSHDNGKHASDRKVRSNRKAAGRVS